MFTTFWFVALIRVVPPVSGPFWGGEVCHPLCYTFVQEGAKGSAGQSGNFVISTGMQDYRQG